mgnify:CR=1 FL=1
MLADLFIQIIILFITCIFNIFCSSRVNILLLLIQPKLMQHDSVLVLHTSSHLAKKLHSCFLLLNGQSLKQQIILLYLTFTTILIRNNFYPLCLRLTFAR